MMRRATWAVVAMLAVALGGCNQATDSQESQEAPTDAVTGIPGFTYIKTETFSCGGVTNTVEIYRHEKTGLEFVLVPGGRFLMGSARDDSRSQNERPQHKVTIDAFLLCRTECTQDAWEGAEGGELRPQDGTARPIHDVTWNEVTAWCRRVGLRLPSEAEWEYACRAGTETRFCFGEAAEKLEDFAWFKANSGGQIHPVAQKKPNAFGLCDMHGNVAEWCQDTLHNSYDGAPSTGEAWVSEVPAGIPSPRMWRGGHYRATAGFCSCSYRHFEMQTTGREGLGFRPACSLPEGFGSSSEAAPK